MWPKWFIYLSERISLTLFIPRFMPPITPSTWKTVRSADRFSPVCPQNIPIPPNGPEALLEVPRARLAQLRRLLPLLKNQSEDCLYLNIYVPYETRRQRRKYLFYLIVIDFKSKA